MKKEKTTFNALYEGTVYVNGYGRNLYCKAVKISDVKNEKEKIIFDTLTVSLSKAFLNIADKLYVGAKISFKAIKENNKLLYISDVKIS